MTILNLKPPPDLAIDSADAFSEPSPFLLFRVTNLPPLSSQNRRVALAVSISQVSAAVVVSPGAAWMQEAISQRRSVNSRRYRKLILAWLGGEPAEKPACSGNILVPFF